MRKVSTRTFSQYYNWLSNSMEKGLNLLRFQIVCRYSMVLLNKIHTKAPNSKVSMVLKKPPEIIQGGK